MNNKCIIKSVHLIYDDYIQTNISKWIMSYFHVLTIIPDRYGWIAWQWY